MTAAILASPNGPRSVCARRAGASGSGSSGPVGFSVGAGAEVGAAGLAAGGGGAPGRRGVRGGVERPGGFFRGGGGGGGRGSARGGSGRAAGLQDQSQDGEKR